MISGIRVGAGTNGQLCNQILASYRGFLFAAVHEIPFEAVAIKQAKQLDTSKLAAGVHGHIITQAEFGSIGFTHSFNCWNKKTEIQRNELFDISLAPTDSIVIWNSTFLYPELPWEFALFRQLFDNVGYREGVTRKYSEALRGGSVGFTVRRKDSLGYPHFRHLSPDEIVSGIWRIVSAYRGLVSVLVASDDLPYVRDVIASASGLSQYVIFVDADADETLVALSLCDYVVSNGQQQALSCYSGYMYPSYESTFGQVASLLNRCYKFGAPCKSDGLVPPIGQILDADSETVRQMIQMSRARSDFRYPCSLPKFP